MARSGTRHCHLSWASCLSASSWQFGVVEAAIPYFTSRPSLICWGQGIFVTIVLVYGLALAFNKLLAIEVAEKNGKVLAVAMFVAFATLSAHIYSRWFSKRQDHE